MFPASTPNIGRKVDKICHNMYINNLFYSITNTNENTSEDQRMYKKYFDLNDDSEIKGKYWDSDEEDEAP